MLLLKQELQGRDNNMTEEGTLTVQGGTSVPPIENALQAEEQALLMAVQQIKRFSYERMWRLCAITSFWSIALCNLPPRKKLKAMPEYIARYYQKTRCILYIMLLEDYYCLM